MFVTLEVKTLEVTLALWEGYGHPSARTWSLAESSNRQTEINRLIAEVGQWLQENEVSSIEGVIRQENGQATNELAEYLARFLTRRWGGQSRSIPLLWNEELSELAKISGMPEITRQGIYDRVAHEAAIQRVNALQRNSDNRLIVACLGDGVSVAAYDSGKVLDVNNSWDGEGPMGLKRAGTLPTIGLVTWAFQSGKTLNELEQSLVSGSGWEAYKTQLNEAEWEKILAYQVVKEIGAMRAVLRNEVDAIVLTGELTRRADLVRQIAEYLPESIPLHVFPGVDVARGLAAIWLQETSV